MSGTNPISNTPDRWSSSLSPVLSQVQVHLVPHSPDCWHHSHVSSQRAAFNRCHTVLPDYVCSALLSTPDLSSCWQSVVLVYLMLRATFLALNFFFSPWTQFGLSFGYPLFLSWETGVLVLGGDQNTTWRFRYHQPSLRSSNGIWMCFLSCFRDGSSVHEEASSSPIHCWKNHCMLNHWSTWNMNLWVVNSVGKGSCPAHLCMPRVWEKSWYTVRDWLTPNFLYTS